MIDVAVPSRKSVPANTLDVVATTISRAHRKESDRFPIRRRIKEIDEIDHGHHNQASCEQACRQAFAPSSTEACIDTACPSPPLTFISAIMLP